MEVFNLYKIKNYDVYLGKIYKIIDIDEELIEKIKFCNQVFYNYEILCKTQYVKNAVVIKLNNNTFIELNSINDLYYLDYNNYKDRLLTFGTNDPYINELFIKEIDPIDIQKDYTDIKTLKLIVENKKYSS